MQGDQLKKLIQKKRLYQWEVADEIGVNEFTLSRWLRKDVDAEKEKMILTAITNILAKK